MSKQLSLLAAVALILVQMGCSTNQLRYTFDPEINYLQEIAQNAKIVAVTVKDSRGTRSSIIKTTSNQQWVNGPDNLAKQLKNQIIKKLKTFDYKIINKPLLADVAYELEINELELTVEKGTFKSQFRAKSKITLTIRKHSESFTKIFTATRNQEVASPANNLEATGVVNQLLTKQLADAFSDQALTEFVNENR